MPSVPSAGTTSRLSSGFSETASHSDDAPDLTPEEFQRRGDATDALSRETALRGAGNDRPVKGLPTPRTTLRARYVALLVWCKGGCQHQAEADLQKLIEAGHGDVPLTRLRFRCSNCGSDRTDSVITSKAATAVQPWRSSAA